MFEYSFVPDVKARPLPIAFACLSEAMLVAGLVIVPLMFVQSLPERGLLNALMLAPVVPMGPPPPPPPMVAARPRTSAPPRKFNPNVLVSPVVIPKAVAMISEAPAVEMEAITAGVPGGIPGVPGAGTVPGGIGTGFGVPPPPPPPVVKTAAPPPPPSVTPKRITVGGDVQSAMLLQQPPPAYPSLARQGHIFGTVVLAAVIGTDGTIKNLAAVSGHPLLIEAAMNAVRQWVYRPTMLNGTAVEVNTNIEVRFRLM